MKILKKTTTFMVFLLIVLLQLFFIPFSQKAYAATTTVNLGTADSFAVLAGAGITVGGAVNSTTITGDIGTFPTTSITGLENVVLSGVNHAGDAVTQGAKTALTAAYTDAAGRAYTDALTQLGGTTKTSGVYKSDATGTFNITGILTLDAQGDPNAVFIFQTGTTLVTAESSSVVLINGAQACNVFWAVGSAATLGSSSTFIGTIMANSEAITDTGYSTVTGRLLARTAAVTLLYTTINKPTCAAGTIGGPALISSSTSTLTNDTTSVPALAYCPPLNYVAPIIIESRRIDNDSVFIRWGPYSGINTFLVEYGTENGKWLYNTKVTGFSTTINALPANQPIWVRVTATDYCSVGVYGEAKLVGGPLLPNTGVAPRENNLPWYILVGIFGVSSFLLRRIHA